MSSNSDKEQPEVVETRDGSHTLYSPRFDQHYHNPNGAVAESKHVFFDTGELTDRLSTAAEIYILEVGFGTGLNLLLLLDEYLASGSSAHITYHSIEAWPVSAEVAASFNYRSYIRHPELADRLPEIFEALAPGQNHFEPLPGVNLHVFYRLFEDYEPKDFKADFIFHDAFSPEVNEELWTGVTFQKLKNCSASDVVLTTYCAASKARGAMAWADWHVARAQGALGKREMTIASLNPDRLEGFKRVNEERLAERYERRDF